MTIKLSELPVHTVIQSEAGEKHIKSEKYIWTEILVDHGYYEVNTLDEREGAAVAFSFNPYIEVTKPLEEYFGKYEILSLPMPVVNTAVWLSAKLRDANDKTIIEDAIKYELVEEKDDED